MSKLTIYEKVSDITGYKPNEIAIIQQNVAKGTTATELAYFLNICKTMKLNPFNKEVWCYKDGRGNLLIFAGRDGFLSKAQQNPLFNGIRSCEVREGDQWSIDVANNNIKHEITKPLKERGKIIGAYCLVFRKGGEPTIEFVDFETYNKGFSAWKTHPSEMIKKVAESHALKKAFGISGIQSEYDFNFDKTASPIKTENIGLNENDVLNEIKNLDKDQCMDYYMENVDQFNGSEDELMQIIKNHINKKVVEI
jgi:phage recombination protein Bet